MKTKLLVFFVIACLIIPCAAFSANFDSKIRDINSVSSFVTDIDSAIQKRFDWDAAGLLLYKGVAASGELSSSGTWRVFKYSYDDADYSTAPDLVQSAEGAWTSRTSLTYR